MSPGGPEPPGYPGNEPTEPTRPLRGPVPPRQPVRPVAPPVVERVPPPLPPEDPWWGNPGAALLVCLVVLLLGGVVGYAIGHSGRSSEGAHTVSSTTTVTQPARVEVRTQTVTSKTVTQAPPNAANEQRRVEAEAEAKKLDKENEELRKAEAG